MGRGKFIGLQNAHSSVSLPKVQPVKRSMQEVNDRIIGEQLREMGIGVSNTVIEEEFHKKFRSKSSPVEGSTTTTVTNKNQENPLSSKNKNSKFQPYVPPHLREKSTCAPLSDSGNENGETDVDIKRPVLSSLPVETVDDTSLKNEAAVESGASNSKNGESRYHLSDDNVQFSKNKPLQAIQFKINRDNVSQLSAKANGSRNALINGLLKRIAAEEKIPTEESDVKRGANVNSFSTNVITDNVSKDSLYKENDRVNHNDTNNNFGNIQFDAMNGFYTVKSNVKSEHSLSSQTSSRASSRCSSSHHNEHIDPDQALYFTTPLSKKKLYVTDPPKTFIEIMPKSKTKPTNSTLGDYIKASENKLSQSSACSTPSQGLESGSNLNPFASEFSPKSINSIMYSSSDGDSFVLDNEEFPPL